MMAQALEANGAIVYILGRRLEVLEKAAATAVGNFFPHMSHILMNFDRKTPISMPSKQT